MVMDSGRQDGVEEVRRRVLLFVAFSESDVVKFVVPDGMSWVMLLIVMLVEVDKGAA